MLDSGTGMIVQELNVVYVLLAVSAAVSTILFLRLWNNIRAGRAEAKLKHWAENQSRFRQRLAEFSEIALAAKSGARAQILHFETPAVRLGSVLADEICMHTWRLLSSPERAAWDQRLPILFQSVDATAVCCSCSTVRLTRTEQVTYLHPSIDDLMFVASSRQ